MLTFVWFGMTLAGMCGTLAVGPILAHYGNQAPYLLALLPAAGACVHSAVPASTPNPKALRGTLPLTPNPKPSARNPSTAKPLKCCLLCDSDLLAALTEPFGRTARAPAGDARSAHQDVAAAHAGFPRECYPYSIRCSSPPLERPHRTDPPGCLCGLCGRLHRRVGSACRWRVCVFVSSCLRVFVSSFLCVFVSSRADARFIAR